MASALARSPLLGSVAPRSVSFQAKPMLVSRVASRSQGMMFSTSRSAKVVPKAVVELAQLAGEAEFITGTAFTMFGITLIGLAIGFVLLRVESLVEEGKL